MGYYSEDNKFFTRDARRNIAEGLAFFGCAIVAISIILTTVYFGKHILFPNNTPPCIKHHQSIEQVDAYGAKKAITVCDQFQGEPATEPAK